MNKDLLKKAKLQADADYEDWRWDYHSFVFYKKPKDAYLWHKCIECGLRPKVWVFDNGRSAHCVCGKDRYHHTHEVSAKPIGDYVRKTGGFIGYKDDDLRLAWNKHILNQRVI